MAAWHYRLSIVPVAGMIAVHGALPPELDGDKTSSRDEPFDEDVEWPNYWAGFPDREGLARRLGELQPQIESWSEEAVMFGVPDGGHRLEFWNDALYVKLDLRVEDAPQLAVGLVNLARDFDCRLVESGSGEVFEASADALFDRIRSSLGYRLLTDREGWLEEVERLNVRPS